jgi:methyl-accepting chemotaxis protein
MATVTATASSKLFDSEGAAREVARHTRAALGSLTPSFGLLFASPAHDLGRALRAARDACGAELIGCSTAGEITERGATHGGLALMLVASDEFTFASAFASGLQSDVHGVADTLDAAAVEARGVAAAKGQRHATSVVLTDGLAGTGERLVAELHARAKTGAQLVGGAAGDEGKFQNTFVGCGLKAARDAAAVLHVFGANPWGVGVNHGLRPTTPQMRVTRAEGNVVYEIAGRPAFTLYQEHAAARGVDLTPERAGPYLIGNELGLHFLDKIARVRAPLAVGADGSLRCAAEIPAGSMVSILDGKAESMLEAVRGAANEAKASLGGRPAAGVLLFDCVCRGMILRSRFSHEIDVVRSVFGSVPVAGFLTYGEIARYAGRLDGWHNATAVVVAIPA